MKIGFLMFFFLIFNAYVMLVSILYLNIEPWLLKLKRRSIDKSLKVFRLILNRAQKKGKVTLIVRLYLFLLFRHSEKILAFYMSEQAFPDEVKQMFEPVYQYVLRHKFRKFKKLDISEQLLILRSLPNIGFVNSDIQNFLIRVMGTDNLFLRATAFHSIILLNRKNYFIEALLYISKHQLNVDSELFASLLLQAYRTIDELTIDDLTHHWVHFSPELRCSALEALAPYYNDENKYHEQIHQGFMDETNEHVRTYFYKYFQLKLTPEMRNRYLQDLDCDNDELRLAAVEFSRVYYDEQVKAKLLSRLYHGTNVDLLYEEAMILLEHHAITMEQLKQNQANINQYQLLQQLISKANPEARWYS